MTEDHSSFFAAECPNCGATVQLRAYLKKPRATATPETQAIRDALVDKMTREQLSLRAVAGKTGVSFSTVGRFINGGLGIHLTHLNAFRAFVTPEVHNQ